VSAPTIRIGTRASRLARWQTAAVAERLGALAGVRCEAVPITTEGDRDRTTPLPEIGGRGVFTAALESALREGRIDVAVHSLKDLPVEPAPDLEIGAVCCRGDAHDVLVARARWTLATLPPGARVGTCSTRRTAQLLAARPDVEPVPLRGNVDTRVKRALAGAYDAVVLAAAGLERLGLADAVSEVLAFERFLPAPGQGALAVQARAADDRVRAWLARLDEAEVRAATDAERAFLAAMGGGCAAPVAAFAEVRRERAAAVLVLDALVAAPRGTATVRVRGEAALADAARLGARLAETARERGAGALLAA
jgi:hydroxymethylbilane synthase